jgi:hypothetical protein
MTRERRSSGQRDEGRIKAIGFGWFALASSVTLFGLASIAACGGSSSGDSDLDSGEDTATLLRDSTTDPERIVEASKEVSDTGLRVDSPYVDASSNAGRDVAADTVAPVDSEVGEAPPPQPPADSGSSQELPAGCSYTSPQPVGCIEVFCLTSLSPFPNCTYAPSWTLPDGGEWHPDGESEWCCGGTP